jgi:hypothetical protein
MSRKARLTLPRVSQHITQRGNNRELRNATEIISPLTCFIVRLQCCDNSYIAGLCACCRALNTNVHSTSHREVISFAFLMFSRQTGYSAVLA